MLRRPSLSLGLVLGLALSLIACGDKDVPLDETPDADPAAPDADPLAPDAAPPGTPDAPPAPPGCSTAPGSTQCNNCLDDDQDGLADGFDPECTGAEDQDEGSFATGIPGDNRDARKQDCFFDGNSGGGQDCAWHTCCLLDNPDTAENECPADLRQGYDPSACAAPQTATCIRDCAPLTPPGCDCFGCCTVCSGTECRDILLNPAVTPACDESNLDACLSCTKNTECGADACNDNPEDCVLCPGQTAEDLPATCGGENSCPNGMAACTDDGDCGTYEYCSTGCCIGAVD
jgi:hypothetical protein